MSQETIDQIHTNELNPSLGIVKVIRQWGGYTADGILDPSSRIFSLPGCSGLIGYRLKARVAVVYGDPVCSPSDLEHLTRAFHDFAKEEGISIVYLGASQHFANFAISTLCKASIEVGKELLLDPFDEPLKKTGPQACLLRRKVKRAQKEEVSVYEHLTSDPQLEAQIKNVGTLWLGGREGPQIHISNIRLFEDRFGKRWFYAKQKGEIIGVVTLNRLEVEKGWLLNHLMVIPKAPPGTSELLITVALDALKKEGCHFVTVGTVTCGSLGDIKGLSPFFAHIAKGAFRFASKVFNLDRQLVFWEKFDPKMRPSYFLASSNQIGLRTLISLRNALS